MTDDEIVRVLVCPPWSARIPAVASERRACAECGCRVAVADSSARVLALGARVLCNACGLSLMEREGIEDVRRAWREDEIE